MGKTWRRGDRKERFFDDYEGNSWNRKTPKKKPNKIDKKEAARQKELNRTSWQDKDLE